MKADFIKGKTEDQIFIRGPGQVVEELRFPKKGVIPHDAVHLIVEQELHIKTGFWGQIAAGARPGEVADKARNGGHASAKRPGNPKPEILELVQAERVVECFEAEMWSGPASHEVFLDVLDAACAQSRVPPPRVTPEQIERVRAALAAVRDQWMPLPIGGSISLDWNPSDPAA